MDKRTLGRNNPPVIAKWTQKTRRDFWNAHKHKIELLNNSQEAVPFTECHLWTGRMMGGYPVVSQKAMPSQSFVCICWQLGLSMAYYQTNTKLPATSATGNNVSIHIICALNSLDRTQHAWHVSIITGMTILLVCYLSP